MLKTNEPFDNIAVIKFLIAVIAVIMVAGVLKVAQVVVLPLIIAWLLSFLIAPPVNFLIKHHVPPILAIVLVLVILLGIIYLAGMFILQRILVFVAAYPKYQAQWTVIITQIFEHYELEQRGLSLIDISKQIQQYLQHYLLTFSSLMLSFVTNLILVVIFLFFILLGQPFSKYKVAKMFSEDRARQVVHITQTTSHGIMRYLWLQTIISIITGVIVGVALTIMGIDFAVTWGVLAFALNFLPNIGSIIAFFPPVLIAFIQYYPSIWPAIITAVVLLAIEQIMGNVITPKILGDSLDLSPVFILVSLLLFGWMWGIMGAIISVPVAVAIKIVCDNIEGLEFLGVMMSSGRKYRKEFKS